MFSEDIRVFFEYNMKYNKYSTMNGDNDGNQFIRGTYRTDR